MASGHYLSADELLAGAALTHDIEIPAVLGPPGPQEAQEHRAILAAAKAGDAALVRALMRGHISSFLARNFPENEVE